jgi:hypothetical protein
MLQESSAKIGVINLGSELQPALRASKFSVQSQLRVLNRTRMVES